MANVYLAFDRQHQCKVALKVPFSDLAPIDGVDRFLQEIRLTAGLDHPYILSLHDSGEAGGHLYYVMPYVREETLRDRLFKHGRMNPAEALKITSDVAEALQYAHRNNVLHRDVKPENIFLRERHAVLADFGIARAIKDATRLTRTGVVVGTASYMAPEQAEGVRDTDERSDLYSLGCVLYEMLTGQPPYVGPTVDTVMDMHIRARIPNVRKLEPHVPPVVADTVKRLLAKQPESRTATAGVLIREVTAAIEPLRSG